MRYQIGEKIIVMGFYHDNTLAAPAIWSSLGAVLSRPELDWKFKLLELTVVEHHKVAWDQDPNGEKKYDGYVLKDAEGLIYYNQYPRASYGQTSDFADRVFTVKLESYDREKLRSYFEKHQVVRYIRVDEYYEPMVEWEKNKFDPEKLELVTKMVKAIDAELAERFNSRIVAEPIESYMPNILSYKVEQLENKTQRSEAVS